MPRSGWMNGMFCTLQRINCGWPKRALHYSGIPMSICVINGTLETHYSIIGGIVGMEGVGPLLGTARKAGVLVMGDKALAADDTAARVMGVDPSRVDSLAMSHKTRLGSLRQEDIDVTCGKIEKVRIVFALEQKYAFMRAL